MPARSIIAGAALGLDLRLWSPRNAATRSSFSASCLLLRRNPCRRFVVSHSAAAEQPPPSISVAFLVDSCGLSPDSAAAAIRKLNAGVARKTTARDPESVLELFRSRGFSGAQIAKILAVQPKVLFSNAERTLKPKIDYLRSEGFSQNDVAKLLTSFTFLLFLSWEKTIKPRLDVLRAVLPSDAEIVFAVMRSRWLLWTDLRKTLLPNSETLRAIGVPEKRISQLIMSDARVLARAPRRFDEYIEILEEIGIPHTISSYILALSALSRLSRATLQKKISFFRSVGFSEEDFFSAFRRAPTISGLSEQNIKKTVELFKGFGLRDDEIPSFFVRSAHIFLLSERNVVKSMDFLVRTLEWSPRDVLSHPVLLGLSLERRLIPRAFVRTTLMSNGLLRGNTVQCGMFYVREDIFVDNYVMKFRNELPHLLEEYEKLKPKDVRSSVSTETSA